MGIQLTYDSLGDDGLREIFQRGLADVIGNIEDDNTDFKKVRKLWCYKHEEWTDCSFDTPGAVWFGGNDTYEVKIVYAIPFWIRDEDDVVNYTDKYCDQDWLYW